MSKTLTTPEPLASLHIKLNEAVLNRLFELLERLSLRNKLIIGFAALLMLSLVLGLQSLRTQYSLR